MVNGRNDGVLKDEKDCIDRSEEFNLSEKIEFDGVGESYFYYSDVKEFIRLLKIKVKSLRFSPILEDHVNDYINKLAGEKLI